MDSPPPDSQDVIGECAAPIARLTQDLQKFLVEHALPLPQRSDQIRGGGGGDSIDGGLGIDTALFSGTVAQYTLERTATGVIIRGVDGVDTLTGVERLLVGSTKVAIDIHGNGGMSYRIYQAAFDRAPDLGGLGFWIGKMDGGMSVTEVAANFVASAEFQNTYGTLNNNQFAAQLYRNVLHRESDAGGLAFWTEALDQHRLSMPEVLANFSESNENQANLIGVIQYGFFYA